MNKKKMRFIIKKMNNDYKRRKWRKHYVKQHNDDFNKQPDNYEINHKDVNILLEQL